MDRSWTRNRDLATFIRILVVAVVIYFGIKAVLLVIAGAILVAVLIKYRPILVGASLPNYEEEVLDEEAS